MKKIELFNIFIDSYICDEQGVIGVNLVLHDEETDLFDTIPINFDEQTDDFCVSPETYDKILDNYNTFNDFIKDLSNYARTTLV